VFKGIRPVNLACYLVPEHPLSIIYAGVRDFHLKHHIRMKGALSLEKQMNEDTPAQEKEPPSGSSKPP